jgi:hypothetical protein
MVALTFLLGAEVSTDMTRFSLWHAHEDAASLPAVATHTYRSSSYSADTFLFSGFEMMLADFVEKAKSACPDFGGVPATACLALVDDPGSLPWAISGAQVEAKFGLSSVRVVRCTTANSGDVECSSGKAFSVSTPHTQPREPHPRGLAVCGAVDGRPGLTRLARQANGQPWTLERVTRHLALELCVCWRHSLAHATQK